MKVKFVPQNIELEVGPEKTLLQYATENGIEIKSICKGVPSCAECRIRVIDGESNVLPPNKAELELIGTNWRIDSRRLACQIRCYGDVTIDMTEQIARQENQTKKVRGYRSKKHQIETQAVQDTMILTEKPEVRDDSRSESRSEQAPREPRSEQAPREPRQQNEEGRQGEGSSGGGRSGRNRNRNRNRQGQNQAQGQTQNQNQNAAGPQTGGPKQPPQRQQQQPGQKQAQGEGRNSGRRGGRGGNQNNRNPQNTPKPANAAPKPERPS